MTGFTLVYDDNDKKGLRFYNIPNEKNMEIASNLPEDSLMLFVLRDSVLRIDIGEAGFISRFLLELHEGVLDWVYDFSCKETKAKP